MSCDHGTDPDAKPEDSGSLPHRDVLGPSLQFWLVSLHYTLRWKPLLPSVDPPGSVGSRVGSAPPSRPGTEERGAETGGGALLFSEGNSPRVKWIFRNKTYENGLNTI